MGLLFINLLKQINEVLYGSYPFLCSILPWSKAGAGPDEPVICSRLVMPLPLDNKACIHSIL